MSTATVAPVTVHRATAAPPAGAPARARPFLAGHATAVLPLVAVCVALELTWPRPEGGTWPAALAVVAGWTLAVAAWLRHRGRPVGSVLTVVGVPAAALVAAAAPGWLSPAGLVLWAPVSTVLAVALASATHPVHA
jgi:hypothetical protein